MSSDEGAMVIRLHPLVVMSVADHYTRNDRQGVPTRAIGVMFGQQTGREVHILETMELAWTQVGQGDAAKPVPAMEPFQADAKLFQEAYPTYEVLGWYSLGAEPSKGDEEIHALMAEFNERPLYLMMNPEVADDAKDLPIKVYEQKVHMVNDRAVTEFASSPFVVTADEAERTTVVHCAEVLHDAGSAHSKAGPQYNSNAKAIRQLNGRVRVLRAFLQDVKAGKIQPEQRILREIKGLCNRLPTMDSQEFQGEFMSEYNDTLLVTYLAALTKATAGVNGVLEKFNISRQPKHGRDDGMGGKGGRSRGRVGRSGGWMMGRGGGDMYM